MAVPLAQQILSLGETLAYAPRRHDHLRQRQALRTPNEKLIRRITVIGAIGEKLVDTAIHLVKKIGQNGHITRACQSVEDWFGWRGLVVQEAPCSAHERTWIGQNLTTLLIKPQADLPQIGMLSSRIMKAVEGVASRVQSALDCSDAGAALGHDSSLEPIVANACFSQAMRSEGRVVTFSTPSNSAEIVWPRPVCRSKTGSKRRPRGVALECHFETLRIGTLVLAEVATGE